MKQPFPVPPRLLTALLCGGALAFAACNAEQTPTAPLATPSHSVTPTAVSGGPFAYVVNNGSHTVSVIDLATNKVIGAIPVGLSPIGVAITPDGTRAYVTSAGDNTVSVIDLSTNTVVGAPIPVSSPVGVAITPDGARALTVAVPAAWSARWPT